MSNNFTLAAAIVGIVLGIYLFCVWVVALEANGEVMSACRAHGGVPTSNPWLVGAGQVECKRELKL